MTLTLVKVIQNEICLYLDYVQPFRKDFIGSFFREILLTIKQTDTDENTASLAEAMMTMLQRTSK